MSDDVLRLREEIERLRGENERLKLEIAAIMRGELFAPDVADIAGKTVSALKSPTGRTRKFKARLSRTSGEGRSDG